MSRGQFRFTYFTPDYDSTVAFHKDGLDLPVLESWDRDADDRGALFAAASTVEKGLPIHQQLKTQAWGHRGFCVREPNGLTVYFFTETKSG